MQRYLFIGVEGKKKVLEVGRYEFLIYRLLRNALKAGDVFVKDSTEFRRFEDDLISDTRVGKTKKLCCVRSVRLFCWHRSKKH